MYFQNPEPIDRQLWRLRLFFELGLRVLQLTYNERSLAGDGCGEATDAGLSDFGRLLIKHCNSLGIAIDVSHCGNKTTLEAIEASSAPVLITHGMARALCDNPRCKTDEAVKACASKGGVVGVQAMGPFISTKPNPTLDDLLDHAQAEGLGAIAVTDHNVFGGALEAVEKARGRKLIVIPGEEVKTAAEGEVIGLFLKEEIPRGMSFGETVAAIRAQGGLVYVPHPFDRLHSIPDAATLQRHLGEIDVFEVYNARLIFEGYNVEALRFARKYNLTAAAGSDAHVLQGVGTGAVRMRRFQGPEEFLVSLRSAEILRRPKSLAYLQGLKWVAQAKERVR